MESYEEKHIDWWSLLPWAICLGFMLAMVAVVSFLDYSYTSGRSPEKAEWDSLCPANRCVSTAQCTYVEEWVWKDTVCWTGYGNRQLCTSIFSSPKLDILVGGTTTKLSGGFYAYNNEGSQPYTLIKGPLDHCPSEKYPEK